MFVKFKTFLSIFLKLYILSPHFIIQLNFNIISLSLSYSITEKIFYTLPKRTFFPDKLYIN